MPSQLGLSSRKRERYDFEIVAFQTLKKAIVVAEINAFWPSPFLNPTALICAETRHLFAEGFRVNGKADAFILGFVLWRLNVVPSFLAGA